MKNLKRPASVFFIFSLIFGALFFRSPNETQALGFIYSLVYGLCFFKTLRVKDLFPILMLFLFLLVLTESPERAFSKSLTYTVQALILFRGLILILLNLQRAKMAATKAEIFFLLGLVFEFSLATVFLYASFKPIDSSVLFKLHAYTGRIFILSALPLFLSNLKNKNVTNLS